MKHVIPVATFVFALLFAVPAFPGPGAHGPGGEHLDAPPPVLSAGHTVPRAEAKSELFELVARVEGGALSVLIDRYETNEPVLDAVVEVESGSVKAKALFRREQGDYAVADAPLLKLLATQGSHPLVFTVTEGTDADLLEGTMQSAGGEVDAVARAGASYGMLAAWMVGGLVPVGAVLLYVRTRRGKKGLR